MRTLVKYEFLKILRRKSTGITMAVSLVVTIFLFGLPVWQYQIYNQEGVLRGKQGIIYEKEQYAELSVPLTEEYITETIRGYQELFENPDNVGYDGNEKFLVGDAYWDYAAPREKLLSILAGTYDDPGTYSGWERLPDMDLTEGAKFYQARAEKLRSLINAPSRHLSGEQKKFWMDQSDSVVVPLQYGYYKGWEIILTSFELLMFALFAVCIVLAPVFSGEYQAGTDAVVLSARYGKTKLVKAKNAAALLFGVLLFSLQVAAAFGVVFAAFGTEGWNLPLQIAGTTIPYPLSFLQAVLLELGVIYLVFLAMIGLTLLLSARMKSPYTVLLVLAPVLFLPLFLMPGGTNGVYNLTLFLLPYRSLMPELDKYVSYQFGSLVLDVHTVRAMVYGLLALRLLPLAGRGFRIHQVCG